ncbi:hypothetical protein AYI69_g1902 [Smittium culicis]|uniref:Uncharacterized protein n=1 Tax=Smittium culicis TaxID=133412 RepID=A0A1R1YP15_9FUNG|nr:hypothetical protein AYI69_g1902 [Smittium culicis]
MTGLEKQILDISRIAVQIVEFSRYFNELEKLSKFQIETHFQEINGSSQDLLRLAFIYTHKWKIGRITSSSQNFGFDKNTTTSPPYS